MFMGNELWRKGALELAGMIAAKEVSSIEVVESHLARIDEVNPHLNAVVRRMDDQARSAAMAADQALARGGPSGPLHGVPFTIKENIDVAGTPTTSSLTAFAEAIASQDAPCVARLKAGGRYHWLARTCPISAFGLQRNRRCTALPSTPGIRAVRREDRAAARPPRWPPG